MTKALYSKYSSSQNYYYTKDINDIMTDGRTPAVIKYKDFVTLDEEDEFLKRYYKRHEYEYKIGLLVEYYKYHKDITRLFMLPITDTLNNYHDKKRKIEYVRITNKLKVDEEKKKNGGVTPKKKTDLKAFVPVTNRMLDKLDFLKED